MNFAAILSDLGAAATKLLPLLPQSTGAVPLLEAGKSIMAAFETVKHANGDVAPADAEAAHQALVAHVSAHAQGTLDRLDG